MTVLLLPTKKFDPIFLATVLESRSIAWLIFGDSPEDLSSIYTAEVAYTESIVE